MSRLALLLLLVHAALSQPPVFSDLPQRPVCPDEVIALNCTINSEHIRWTIAELGVNFVLADDGTPIGLMDSRFFGSVVSKAENFLISSLTFTANTSFNGLLVECADTSTFPHTISNITLNFTLATPPYPPVNLSSNPLNCSSLIATWDAPLNTEEIPITSYSIKVDNTTELNTTGTRIILTALEYNTEYNISISAINCIGRGEEAFLEVIIEIDPEPPLNLTVSLLDCSSLNVTWLRPAIVGFSDVFSYELMISPAPSSPAGNCIDGACTTDKEFLIVTGLELYSMEYTINVRTSLCSTDSFSSNATMTQEPLSKSISLSPLNISPLSCDTVLLSWIESEVFPEYHVTVTSTDGYHWNASTSVAHISAAGLTHDTAYTALVYADMCKESGISRNFSLAAVVSSPNNLTVTSLNCSTAYLQWSEPLLMPSSINYRCIAYFIQWESIKSSHNLTDIEDTSVTIGELELSRLSYTFTVAASLYNCTAKSSNVSITIEAISACIPSVTTNVIAEESVSSSSCSITPCLLISTTATPAVTNQLPSTSLPVYFWIFITLGFSMTALLAVLMVLTCYFGIKNRKLVKAMSQVSPECRDNVTTDKIHLLSHESYPPPFSDPPSNSIHLSPIDPPPIPLPPLNTSNKETGNT